MEGYGKVLGAERPPILGGSGGLPGKILNYSFKNMHFLKEIMIFYTF